MNNTNNSGIYIHIPFCIRKCKYCDFLSFNKENADMYVEALIREIQCYNYDRTVDSVFFGGGTPSVLSSNSIARILENVYNTFNVSEDCEVTMECNPGTLTKESVSGYVKAGVNRISIGLQSTIDEELKALGRIHTYNEFLKSYDMVRNAGIHNVNIDIMSAIPLQTIKSYETTLDRVMSLRPEHISAYSLIIEEGTPFYDMNQRGELLLPKEEDERKMYHLTKTLLAANGYDRYEISNYSLKNFESRHNIKYWERKEYIGLGLGASSLIDNMRCNNIKNYSEYLSNSKLENIRENITFLNKEDMVEEYMYLGLRMIKGIDAASFEREFGRSLESVYGNVINKLLKEKLVAYNGKNLALTEFGIDISNRVMAEFLLDILE